jgi:DNA-directed RNA polymerase subunit M/transcription elongation factor TFIIS
MALKVICPNCGSAFIVKFLKSGDIAKCKSCKKDVIIPDGAIEVNESEWQQLNTENDIKTDQHIEQKIHENDITKTKFQTASKVGESISFVGWFIVILTVIAAFYIFSSASGTSKLIGIIVLLIGCPLGIQIVTNGQVLQALISIANNTDKSVQLLKEISNKVK